MKRTGLIILSCLPLLAMAQSLSIETVWEQATQFQKYRQQQLQVSMRETERTIALRDRLPVFWGDGNLQRNLIIPTTPVPAIAFDPNAGGDEILPLKFATKWTSKAGLQLQWNLFDPARKPSIKEKEIALEKAKLELAQTLEDWQEKATLAYASVVLATHQYNLSREDSITYAAVLEISRERLQAGRESSYEYNNALQEMERKKLQLSEAWSVLVDAHLELKKYISLDSVVQLSSDIATIKSFLKSRQANQYELKILQLEDQLAELQISSVKRGLLPSVTFNGYYGTQFYSNSFNLFNSDRWYGNSYANIALRLPISDLIWSTPQLKKQQLNRQFSSLRLEEQAELDSISRQQTFNKILRAEKQIEHRKKIAGLALENRQNLEESYKAGRLLLSEYNKAASAYIKAMQDLWQAEYNWIEAYFQ